MNDDDFGVEVKDLAIDEICELLREAGTEVSCEQAAQLARFIAEAGGLEDARQVLAQLAHGREAA